jgi:hypothetical protein
MMFDIFIIKFYLIYSDQSDCIIKDDKRYTVERRLLIGSYQKPINNKIIFANEAQSRLLACSQKIFYCF